VALVRFLLDDSRFGEQNRETISGWAREWLPQAREAALALSPLADEIPTGIDADKATERVQAYAGQMLEEAGLRELCSLVGYEPARAEVPTARRVVRRTRPARRARSAGLPTGQASDGEPSAPPPTPTDAEGTYDFVGIVMAKSAEGDAVARILRAREDIAVHEQPAFWDIRAKDRLVIPYEQVSEELGYEIDAYSIQHEMSTHYGRMVATDDALMLFSDPTEAMEHLMS
jgi:propane monooxygenase coupling protein